MADSDGFEEISLDDIDDQAEQVDGPDERARKELNDLNFKNQQFAAELGVIGKIFGGRTEKPGNISGLVIVICLLAAIGLLIWPPKNDIGVTLDLIFNSLVGIVTLTLGYLFGSNTKD